MVPQQETERSLDFSRTVAVGTSSHLPRPRKDSTAPDEQLEDKETTYQKRAIVRTDEVGLARIHEDEKKLALQI